MTLPPPRRHAKRRSPRVRHGDQHENWAKVASFSRTALRAGAGDDVASLTSTAKKRRFVLEGRSLRLVAIFLIALALSAAIAAFSSRSVEVAAIEPAPPCSMAPEPAEVSPMEQATPAAPAPTEPILAHVSGHVNEPGVVRLQPPARVVDAVEKAGGPTEEADLALINLAQPIEDGAHIHVPAQGERSPVAGIVDGAGVANGSQQMETTVNINLATQSELETIPGVGPVTAQAIVSWRESNGAFTSVDQLIEVNGIGPKTLEQLREHVRVE